MTRTQLARFVPRRRMLPGLARDDQHKHGALSALPRPIGSLGRGDLGEPQGVCPVAAITVAPTDSMIASLIWLDMPPPGYSAGPPGSGLEAGPEAKKGSKRERKEHTAIRRRRHEPRDTRPPAFEHPLPALVGVDPRRGVAVVEEVWQ